MQAVSRTLFRAVKLCARYLAARILRLGSTQDRAVGADKGKNRDIRVGVIFKIARGARGQGGRILGKIPGKEPGGGI